jgi:hypothetical protein
MRSDNPILDRHLATPDLTAAATELAARRALSPQPGDADDLPTLRFEDLRGRLPIRARPRLWAWRPAWVGLSVAAAAAAALALVLLRPSPHIGIKGTAHPCGSAELRLAVRTPEEGLRPLAARTVAAGDLLVPRATLSASCWVALYDVDLARRTADEVDLEHDFRLASPGKHVLVLLATVQRAAPDREALFALLRSLGEGKPCAIGEAACTVDLYELESR